MGRLNMDQPDEPSGPPAPTEPLSVRLVALAGHRRDEGLARRALESPLGPLRAAALGALSRMGRLRPDDLSSALSDADAGVRRRACELAPDIAVTLLRSLTDPEPLVVEAAAWALGERADRTATASLARVATGHPDPLCREAAVAALGAIGDHRGLPAILAALDDRPAVRRRAVLALAPFEGEEVERALERAAGDRDWQVRQGANDLLNAGKGLSGWTPR
jgi:HEAT repeat protein